MHEFYFFKVKRCDIDLGSNDKRELARFQSLVIFLSSLFPQKLPEGEGEQTIASELSRDPWNG